MSKIRVTKEFSFETAHALDGYEGKCKNIHGHSYQLKVTVIGNPDNNITAPACGMVIDFGDIKSIVKIHVEPIFDHCLILREDSRFRGLERENEKVRYVNYQPTCENMLLEIVVILQHHFTTDFIQLHTVHLRETATSFAEWHLNDNL